MARSLIIGGIEVGGNREPPFWPDIDLYFHANVKRALDLVDRIAGAGCRFFKGAVLHDASISLEGEHEVIYFDHIRRRRIREPYHAVIKRHVLPLRELSVILEHARRKDLKLILSVYDLEGLEFAVAQGAAAIKIPSSNIVHAPLIVAACAAALPLIIDTGRARFAEIERAVKWVRGAGAEHRLMLQHSPPAPPATPDKFHMHMIAEMAAHFDCLVGLSDHHPDLDMVPIAIAVGCCAIEKGVVDEVAGIDVDVAHALRASDLPRVMQLIADSWAALGSLRRPDADVPAPSPDRMGLVAISTLAPGVRVGAETVRFAFPRIGIGVEHWPEVLGRHVKRALAQGMPVRWDDLE